MFSTDSSRLIVLGQAPDSSLLATYFSAWLFPNSLIRSSMHIAVKLTHVRLATLW